VFIRRKDRLTENDVFLNADEMLGVIENFGY